ncbi:DNA-directed RNA polymerase subunit alpha C-terminal domain-containing protein [Merismopedia glauca]|uniref:RNA polymerase alpha subunit C-terminal domain-containing protein n=1 Tax=Merismopedia glauca CCAP 1448/3 TaxID=1296344 RepID=A0A2T1BZI2_9CYAN|nr:DNA-directed RNA polymerase subunit alpha C-terminal domain-containing protein [Merismopedia glauca]PSB01364.1 hypothetical protein C7B64_18685 [Merismopedia glauca CCAP 1448/3]
MEELNLLSPKAQNVIKKAKLQNAEEISQYPNEKFLKIKGCGLTTLAEIREHFPAEETDELNLGQEFEISYRNPEELANLLCNHMTAEQITRLILALIKRVLPHD